MKICTINAILLSIILCLILTIIFLRNKKIIARFFKKNQVTRFVVTVLIPFIIPFILSILFAVDQDFFSSKTNKFEINSSINIVTILLICISFINLIFQFISWCKEKKESDIRWENASARKAYDNLHLILKDKTFALRTAYHTGFSLNSKLQNITPYNIFDHIRKLTWGFCCTISDITNIPTKDLDAAFIYHYCYSGASEKDKQWRWVTGKGSKFNLNLEDFIKNTNSTFNHMAYSNISVLLYNDKTDALKDQNYQAIYRDFTDNGKGSIFSAKIAFSGNNELLCEGILMINTYGKQFLDDLPQITEKEFLNLISHDIFPCYRQLLTTELAMLYFKHEIET